MTKLTIVWVIAIFYWILISVKKQRTNNENKDLKRNSFSQAKINENVNTEIIYQDDLSLSSSTFDSDIELYKNAKELYKSGIISKEELSEYKRKIR